MLFGTFFSTESGKALRVRDNADKRPSEAQSGRLISWPSLCPSSHTGTPRALPQTARQVDGRSGSWERYKRKGGASDPKKFHLRCRIECLRKKSNVYLCTVVSKNWLLSSGHSCVELFWEGVQPASMASIFGDVSWPSFCVCISRSRSLPLPPPVSSPQGTNAAEWLLHSLDMKIQIGHVLRSPGLSDWEYTTVIEAERNTWHTPYPDALPERFPLGLSWLLFPGGCLCWKEASFEKKRSCGHYVRRFQGHRSFKSGHDIVNRKWGWQQSLMKGLRNAALGE